MGARPTTRSVPWRTTRGWDGFAGEVVENDLRSAENQQLGAVIGYLNALTLLDVQLGTTLDTWHIALRD